jgi:hypothetical protein
MNWISVKVLLISAIVGVSNNSYAGLFGPSSFEECVLDNIKGVKGDVAAAAVNRACRAKFPAQTVQYEQKYLYSFNGLKANTNGLASAINNLDIQSIKTESYNFTLNVTNRNQFPIEQILVGVPKI